MTRVAISKRTAAVIINIFVVRLKHPNNFFFFVFLSWWWSIIFPIFWWFTSLVGLTTIFSVETPVDFRILWYDYKIKILIKSHIYSKAYLWHRLFKRWNFRSNIYVNSFRWFMSLKIFYFFLTWHTIVSSFDWDSK